MANYINIEDFSSASPLHVPKRGETFGYSWPVLLLLFMYLGAIVLIAIILFSLQGESLAIGDCYIGGALEKQMKDSWISRGTIGQHKVLGIGDRTILEVFILAGVPLVEITAKQPFNGNWLNVVKVPCGEQLSPITAQTTGKYTGTVIWQNPVSR